MYAMEEGLVWKSLAWRDGTKYDGLTKEGMMHSHGVLTFPNKDRYEGMFEEGKMHGAGVYVWNSGMVYRGNWQQGVMHGCGTCIWKAPAAGVHAVEGKFFGDEYVGEIMPCSTDDATDSAVDADVAAYQARSFQWPRKQQTQQQQWKIWGRQQQEAPMQQPTAAAAAARSRGGGGGLLLGTSSKAASGGPAVDVSLPVDAQQELRLAALLQRLATDKARADSSKAQQLTQGKG